MKRKETIKMDRDEYSLDMVLWSALKKHFGHSVCIARYGSREHPASYCLECEDCNEVVLDSEIYTICVREDVYPKD